MESPYDVLSIDPDAEDHEIEQAYRRRVKEAHPDQGGSVAEFQRVRAAYERIVSGDPSAAFVEDGTTSAGSGPTAGPSARSTAEPVDRTPTTVEYLNYDALTDRGWSLEDDDLFEKAKHAGLNGTDFGSFTVDPDEYLLEAAEDCGFTWPFACRGGACANCAVSVACGDLSTPVDHILTDDLVDEGFRLSCMGTPETDELRVVYNVKHVPDLEDLLLPPRPFREAHG